MSNNRIILTGWLVLFITAAAAAQPVYHTLEKGETLYALSRKYQVSVQEIMQANEISSPETLSAGSRLLIPSKNREINPDISSHDQYIVKKGDTFYRIARAHGMTVSELMALNDFSGSRILRTGEVINVAGTPVSERPEPEPTETRLPPPDNDGGMTGSVSWPVEGVKKALTGKLRGVIIEAAEYSMVCSVASGKVVWTGPYRGFGQVILIDVDGYIYLYGGNEDIFVNVGEFVSAGSRIGRLGNSGLASRTVNMYFSVFKDGIPVSVVSAPRG